MGSEPGCCFGIGPVKNMAMMPMKASTANAAHRPSICELLCFSRDPAVGGTIAPCQARRRTPIERRLRGANGVRGTGQAGTVSPPRASCVIPLRRPRLPLSLQGVAALQRQQEGLHKCRVELGAGPAKELSLRFLV